MVDEGNDGAREGTGGAVVETAESLLCFSFFLCVLQICLTMRE
jgi:hypothetical protein